MWNYPIWRLSSDSSCPTRGFCWDCRIHRISGHKDFGRSSCGSCHRGYLSCPFRCSWYDWRKSVGWASGIPIWTREHTGGDSRLSWLLAYCWNVRTVRNGCWTLLRRCARNGHGRMPCGQAVKASRCLLHGLLLCIVRCIADRDDIVLYPYPHCPNGPVLGYKVRKVFHIPVFPGHSRDRNLSGKGIGRYR